MVEKKTIKDSEARILVYLSVVHNTNKYVTAIANKLEMDYSYCMRILQQMVFKGWINKHPYKRHMFYDITEKAPLETAKKGYGMDDFQKNMMEYATEYKPVLQPDVVKEEYPNDLYTIESEETTGTDN